MSSQRTYLWQFEDVNKNNKNLFGPPKIIPIENSVSVGVLPFVPTQSKTYETNQLDGNEGNGNFARSAAIAVQNTSAGFGNRLKEAANTNGQELTLMNDGNETQQPKNLTRAIPGTKATIIDIVGDFWWTETKPNSMFRDIAPHIFLKEKEIQTSAAVTQAMYELAAAGDLASRLGATGTEKIGDQLSKLQSQKIGNGIVPLENTIGEEFISIDAMYPYNGLYILRPTNFVYKIPFFENEYFNLSSSFSKNSSDSAKGLGGFDIKGMLRNFGDTIDSVAGTVNILEPGTYIEKTQQYSPSSDTDTVDVKFQLLNTKSFEDTVKNFQFLYLLIYQNSPRRESRDLLAPPVIYEANLRGTRYMPFCYISQLTIAHMGSRRLLDLDLAPGHKLRTTVPDAYDIKITLKSLVASSQNFLYTMSEIERLVTVGE